MEAYREEVILKIAGEGGGIMILGRWRGDGSGWEFARKTLDYSMAMLGTGLGDVSDANFDYRRRPPLIWGSCGEAIGLIDRYPWAMLIPREVHSEFKAEILVEVTHRLISDHPKYAFSPASSKNSAMDLWLKMCK